MSDGVAAAVATTQTAGGSAKEQRWRQWRRRTRRGRRGARGPRRRRRAGCSAGPRAPGAAAAPPPRRRRAPASARRPPLRARRGPRGRGRRGGRRGRGRRRRRRPRGAPPGGPSAVGGRRCVGEPELDGGKCPQEGCFCDARLGILGEREVAAVSCAAQRRGRGRRRIADWNDVVVVAASAAADASAATVEQRQPTAVGGRFVDAAGTPEEVVRQAEVGQDRADCGGQPGREIQEEAAEDGQEPQDSEEVAGGHAERKPRARRSRSSSSRGCRGCRQRGERPRIGEADRGPSSSSAAESCGEGRRGREGHHRCAAAPQGSARSSPDSRRCCDRGEEHRGPRAGEPRRPEHAEQQADGGRGCGGLHPPQLRPSASEALERLRRARLAQGGREGQVAAWVRRGDALGLGPDEEVAAEDGLVQDRPAPRSPRWRGVCE